MKKIIYILVCVISISNAWEINTHRAIDKTAIESNIAINLVTFIESSGIKNQSYEDEIFEGYGVTYFDYFDKDESSDAMAEWGQEFKKYDYQDLIEADTMLEEAKKPKAFSVQRGGER